MKTLCYPAVFHVEEDVEGYWIEFPDLPGCFSQGKNEYEAYDMAKDALSLYCDTTYDIYEREISDPSTCSEIMKRFPGELVMLVEVDADHYARKYNTRAVKKTLSIPQWLNDKAVKANVNFSQVLQEALINKLNL